MSNHTRVFRRDDLPDHLDEEIGKYVDVIFKAVFPLIEDVNSLNFMMAALSWVSFVCIKESVATHHQQNAVLNQARCILKNIEKFKDRDFFKSQENKE